MAPAEPHALPFRPKGEIPHFAEEKDGWKGYIEWEEYPEKKKQVQEIMKRYDFPEPPEFQFVPLPTTNPVLTGERWKQYHDACGLSYIHKDSWETVLKEKASDMIHVLQFPYNGEPPGDRLIKTELTNNKDFFVRNHGGIPSIDPTKFTLDICGLVKNPQQLTLAQLQDESLFPRQSNIVTIQCSGTRRIEQIHEYPGDGDELINAPWGEGAISTARWTGVSLKKIIKHCGGLVAPADNIELYGADTYFKKGNVHNYIVSVPYRKVKSHEVLLAWEMNGHPLPTIHGSPLRAVVYGYIGARSVKWLYKIKAIHRPSTAPVQAKEYLYYTPQIGKQNAQYSNGFSIQDMPVSSAIISPKNMDQIVHEGKIRLSGGDGGSIWYEVPAGNMSTKYFYAWRTWWIDLPVDAEGWLEMCVRCWDNAMNTQPTFVRSAWNWDLHVTSSCHRVKLYSINRSRPGTAARLKQLEDNNIPIVPITRPIHFDLETDEEYLKAMESRAWRDPLE
ncbi:Oxidoreductase, molybdopterin-binding domain-containing protein [Apiosordaria backusii]|uniref:Oxidoreductase, molybdopterin-binding domain-containing protein n=1 Tax=Apiosordaria backusii TaxID=314023 RepID=A0AA40ASW3_9PEZI|nr:Oxidoreductase, molybdopterin-binding domain-containing protein [Apiosordaria backusii]